MYNQGTIKEKDLVYNVIINNKGYESDTNYG